jgi:hypothetical protein
MIHHVTKVSHKMVALQTNTFSTCSTQIAAWPLPQGIVTMPSSEQQAAQQCWWSPAQELRTGASNALQQAMMPVKQFKSNVWTPAATSWTPAASMDTSHRAAIMAVTHLAMQYPWLKQLELGTTKQC